MGRDLAVRILKGPIMKWMLFLSLLGAMACGDEDNRPPVVVIPDAGNNNNTNNMEDAGNNTQPDADMGGDDTGVEDMSPDATDDMDTDSDMDVVDPCASCTPEEICVEDVCLARDSCAIADDIGMLMPGTPVTRTGSFVTLGVDSTESSCGGENSSRERVIVFELAERSLVSYTANWTGQFDGVLDFRSTCEEPSSSVECTDIEFGERFLDAGTHYLVMEMKFGNPGEYSIELEAQPAACNPGERACIGNDLEICSPAGEEAVFACGDTCGGNACAGDSCAAPIVVSGNGGTFSGASQPYTGLFNFSQNASCGNAATPGYDIVFSLPGLQSGDVVTIDTATGDANSNGIFIMEGCSTNPTCIEAFTTVEDIDWVVQTPGDYFVVIDKSLNTPSPFTYTIQIN